MQSRSIIIKILYWLEVIISARILLFTLPVLLNNLTKGHFSFSNPEDFFITTLTVLGVYYFCVGIVAILEKPAVRLLHILGLILIAGLTAVLLRNISVTSDAQFETYHFIPIFLSILFTLIVLVLGGGTSSKIKMKWKSILIIDDDEILIRTVRPMLMSNGYSVLTSNTGEEGLRVAKAQKPDLILLDVIMPGMKGRDVCQALKESDDTKNIPVVFLTAKDSQEDIDAELAAGGEAHLTKPVNREGMLSTIQTIIDKK